MCLTCFFFFSSFFIFVLNNSWVFLIRFFFKDNLLINDFSIVLLYCCCITFSDASHRAQCEIANASTHTIKMTPAIVHSSVLLLLINELFIVFKLNNYCDSRIYICFGFSPITMKRRWIKKTVMSNSMQFFVVVVSEYFVFFSSQSTIINYCRFMLYAGRFFRPFFHCIPYIFNCLLMML